ncbi:MAG: PAN domain-containing protein, partial [Pseudomonadota bacterium]
MRIFATALVWLAVFCAAALAQTRVSPSGTLNDLRNTALRGTVPIEEIEMRSGQRARCAETCSAHPLCRGFNWRKGAEGRRPQCTLLHRVFETVQSPFFHSGVRSGQTPVFDGTREADAELLGEVAHEFALPDAKPVLCRDACSRDKGCAGWTYLRPDVLRIGSAPVCRMLTAVTERRAAPCCVSGQRRETFQAFRY